MHAPEHGLPHSQAVAAEACTLMWALMDHNVQLMEDFKHSNLDDPSSPLPASAVAQPAVMVRPSVWELPIAGFNRSVNSAGVAHHIL